MPRSHFKNFKKNQLIDLNQVPFQNPSLTLLNHTENSFRNVTIGKCNMVSPVSAGICYNSAVLNNSVRLHKAFNKLYKAIT